MKVYLNVAAVMPIPMQQNIPEVLAQEFLDIMIVTLQCGKIDPTAWKGV